jgi:16S rRNA (cytosine1402-N4)-methyltransferase
MDSYHRPALVEEVAELFRPLREGVVVDATYGGGGHTARLLEEMDETVSIIGIDRDPAAARQGRPVTVVTANFTQIEEVLADQGGGQLVGVLFDFGVSSHQLESAERGFSYHQTGPLDMRMGPDAMRTAHEIVNQSTADELSKLIRRFGEDPHAGRIAAAIVAARPVTTTTQLAEVVAAAVPVRARQGGHPARRTFQAIRIAANDELAAISAGLEAALGLLAPGGRCVAISYHSLEDRIVKRRFVAGAVGCVCPADLPVCGCGQVSELRLLTRRPIRPSAAEIAANPRSRSARLRAAEKVGRAA